MGVTRKQKTKQNNCAKLFNQKGRKIIFVCKLILYTLVGVKYEKVALVVQYCLKSGWHAICAMLRAGQC